MKVNRTIESKRIRACELQFIEYVPHSAAVSLSALRKINRHLRTLAVASLQLILVLNTQAATVIVNSNGDGIINFECTLRNAVDTINNEGGLCSFTGEFGVNDEILFDLPTFPLPGGGTAATTSVVLTAGLIETDQSLIINGGDARAVEIFQGSNGIGGRIFSFTGTGTSITLKNLRLSQGSALNGGAIYASNVDLTLEDVTVADSNASDSGGGIYAVNSFIRLERSIIDGNSAESNGGGIAFEGESSGLYSYQSSISNNTATANGGGIYSSNVLTSNNFTRKEIIKSTIANNQANNGGGLFLTDSSNFKVDTSTISGNLARSGFGGAISIIQNSKASLFSTTVSNNTAINSSGILIVGAGSKARLFESIVANSEGGGADCRTIASGVVEIINTSANLIEDGSCATSAITGDPKLDSLKDNGGITLTHALLEGSPAINAGAAGGSFGVPCTFTDQIAGNQATDQRGAPRVSGPLCDLGAYEYQDTSSFFVIPLKNGNTAIFSL